MLDWLRVWGVLKGLPLDDATIWTMEDVMTEKATVALQNELKAWKETADKQIESATLSAKQKDTVPSAGQQRGELVAWSSIGNANGGAERRHDGCRLAGGGPYRCGD